ncbi:MAG: hypothetical protein ACOYYS_25885 [Chloroflexota bacterium]
MKKTLFLTFSLFLLWTLGAQPLLGNAASLARPRADFNGDGYADLVIGVPYEAITDQAGAGAVHVLHGAASTGLGAAGSQLWYQSNDVLTDIAEAGDEFGYALAIGDFNGDRYYDLAVGVHGESIGNPVILQAGVVHILYGSATGVSAEGDQVWHQDREGILDQAEADDRFGYSLAAGDFNGDGYADLAVGSFREDVGTAEVQNAGMVQVLYGSASGLRADGNQMFYQGAFNLEDTAEVDDWFGITLAAGDFDHDGFSDLAAGVPFEDVDTQENAGAVQVLFGAATGLNASRDQFLHQGLADVEGEAIGGDRFGHALATGDSNGDGYCDLAVGIPYKNVAPGISDAGAVHLFHGADSGLDMSDDLMLNQNTPSAADDAEANDWFGGSLAFSDFDGNGFADLAVGVDGEDIGDPLVTNAGAVHVFYSNTSKNELWYQGKDGLAETTEANDRFGTSLAAGDFNADGRIDLAVGVPLEDREGVSPLSDAGVVQVIYGSSTGLAVAGNQLWTQDSDDIGGAGEDNDRFGQVLAAVTIVRVKIYLPVIVR